MPMRPTHYQHIHDEFYSPAGLSPREKRPIRRVGYDMGLRGQRVTQEFLDDQAQVYHGRLNSALHTIDQRADIVGKRSGDFFRNSSLVALAVGGLAILALALTVDYKILHDFWTTIYQNKFLQVPESLKDNVMFKSLQVLFAVLAIHFLISAPGLLGKALRGVFMVAIGVMVIGMLVGLGFLATKSTLPADSTLLGRQVAVSDDAPDVSNDQILNSLGLRASTGAVATEAKPEKTQREATIGDIIPKSAIADSKNPLWNKFRSLDFNSMGTIVFFATFSLIFLFVSSVGALCMHYSLKSFNALFGGVTSEYPEHALPEGLQGVAYWALGKGEWRPRTRKDLADQRQRILHAQRLIGDPGYREGLMQRFFSEFSAGYMEGLHDRDGSPRKLAGKSFEDLRSEMRAELNEARGQWSAATIEERLPDVELRRSLGYNPDRRTNGSPFGYVSNLVASRRQPKDGGVLEEVREDDGRSSGGRISAPATGNVRPLTARRPFDGEVA